MTEDSKDVTIMLTAFFITIIFVCIFTNYHTKLTIEKDLKDGELRLFDNQYSCQMTGKYVSDERFVPKEVTLDILPDDIKKQLKETK